MVPERYTPYLLSLLRIVAGFLFLFHGLQKLTGAFGGQVVPLASLFGLAGVIEGVGGTLIMLGLFTRPVAFLASGQMAAAFFMAHLPKGALPIGNGGELAALYSFVFLYLSARGGGPISADALLRGGTR